MKIQTNYISRYFSSHAFWNVFSDQIYEVANSSINTAAQFTNYEHSNKINFHLNRVFQFNLQSHEWGEYHNSRSKIWKIKHAISPSEV